MSMASTQQMTPPHQWTQLLQKLAPASDFLAFSKSQVLSLSNSPETPKFKELVKLLPNVYKKYEQNCQYFRQLILLQYLLLLKGYSYGNQDSHAFTNICLSTLQQLLKYRALVILAMWKTNILPQFVCWYSQWLQLLVPAILAVMANRNRRDKKQKDKQCQPQIKTKTLIGVIQSINSKKNGYYNGKQMQSNSNSKQYDHILIILEALLIHRIRSHLNCQSLFQFDSILRKLYSPTKLKMIYQGRGCISHMGNKQKQREDREKQLNEYKLIQISGLFPARIDETGWKLIQLQIQAQQKTSMLKLKKCQSNKIMQQWIVEAFQNLKPQPMRISFSTLLNKMKVIQIYRFLCNLQLYGSSPNIQILNQYITDQKLLQFFTKFLLGQNLAQCANVLLNGKFSTSSLLYSYRNQKFIEILQFCMNQALKLNYEMQRNIFVEEFRNKLLATSKDNQKTQISNHQIVSRNNCVSKR